MLSFSKIKKKVTVESGHGRTQCAGGRGMRITASLSHPGVLVTSSRVVRNAQQGLRWGGAATNYPLN